MIDDQTFSREVISRGLMSFQELKQVESLASARGISRFEAALVTKTLSESRLMRLVADLYDMPLLDLSDLPIDRQWVRKLPLSYMQNLGVMALGPATRDDAAPVQVAMVNPHDVDAIEVVGQRLGCEIAPVLVLRDDLERTLNRYLSGPHKATITRPTAPVTSPTSEIPIDEPTSEVDDGFWTGLVEEDSRDEALMADLPSASMKGGVGTRDMAGFAEIDEVRAAIVELPGDDLLRATVALLIERRIFSLEELRRTIARRTE